VTGAGVGLLMPFRKLESLKESVPSMQGRLSRAAMACYLLFAAVSTLEILLSSLRMGLL
jgi:hypothetical protein